MGVDGSPDALAALRFALAEARLRGAEVQAVSAWHYPDTFGGPVILAGDYDLEAIAHRALDEAITATKDQQTGLTVNLMTTQGRAASALLDAAAGADLLVVGSRGRGGFAGLLLGSVSQQCVHHAPCPVVVVPAPPG